MSAVTTVEKGWNITSSQGTPFAEMRALYTFDQATIRSRFNVSLLVWPQEESPIEVFGKSTGYELEIPDDSSALLRDILTQLENDYIHNGNGVVSVSVSPLSLHVTLVKYGETFIDLIEVKEMIDRKLQGLADK